ncbi:E3 ubiquitin-protein ligase RNF185 [Zea mays]|jgi:E3 ubiquitin-protein ligase RNF5|uniref:E3 ubiquitin-protein ligase RMA n=2 Tax=Zea mays TaxID=4577 RepID=B6SSJ0_MAIZE|nr:zinc finger, C3HC4 type family protein [Zea mays]PWZ17726.1 E3 ubiquitin-protein ligase RNF185 [Zea mays]
MAADDAARSSRRMDLNLYLGLPRAPRARRPDLGFDLALGTPMLSSSSPSSSAASADAPPLETDPLHPPYSPSRADLMRPPTPAHEPYNPFAPEAHPPYVPPPPLPVAGALPVLADELEFGFSDAHLGLVERLDRPSSSTASSSFRPDLAERYRHLMSLGGSRFFRPRRFRSDLPPLSSELPSLENDAAVQPPEPEEPVHDTVEENKVVANGAVVGVSEDDGTEHGKSAPMFECNICFEMADEPVVTSCGHLFCWPCLYQWLHVHSSHKECPVCKGEVTEGNITPIYGRGNSGSEMEKKVAEDGKASGPKIPPRPHGNRLESFRQQFHHLRPISRRLGEAHGFLSTWRRILDRHLANSMSRFEGPPEPSVSETAQHASSLGRMTTRLRARRWQREAENPTSIDSSAPDSGQPVNNTFDLPRRSSNPFPSEGMDLLRHIAFTGLEDSERFATAVSELRRIARASPYGASTSSNPPNPEPFGETQIATALAADQASNSSTMAVIQEDAAFTGSAGEPSNAGSSRPLRRRGSDALGSLDVDGGDLHQNKRRRLN